MTLDMLTQLRRLEGRHVRLVLADGSELADCELVSAGHRRRPTMWVLLDGADVFFPLAHVEHCALVA